MPYLGANPNIVSQIQHIWHLLVPYTRGRVIDVASGPVKAFPHWMTLDTAIDQNGVPVGTIKGNAFDPLPFKDNSLDAVVASHIIDLTEDPIRALTQWWAAVKVGGHLVVHWPDPANCPAPDDPQGPQGRRAEIYGAAMDDLMRGIAAAGGEGWTLVESETRSQNDEYSVLKIYRKSATPECVVAPWRKPEKGILVVRYGGAGDQMVASSILPELKRRGYHVTYNGAPLSELLLRHDPHIDQFWTQDVDQVPNMSLGEYHRRLRLERWSEVIHLNESVERDLLATPGSVKQLVVNSGRHAIMNVNYLERTHDIAGLPHVFEPRFYANEDEERKIGEHVGKLGGPTMLWVLKGSSVHKLWPYWHIAAVRVLARWPDASIIMAGEEACQQIEGNVVYAVGNYVGDHAVQRLNCTSGRWPIRGTMALAQKVDMVVGPETGVLNGVCMDDVTKIIMLSHSSEENLTKHWRETIVLKPPEGSTPCYPCHMMHNGFDTCTKHEPTNTALCAANISVDMFVAAIAEGIERARVRKIKSILPMPLMMVPGVEPYVPSHLKPVEERDIMTFKRPDAPHFEPMPGADGHFGSAFKRTVREIERGGVAKAGKLETEAKRRGRPPRRRPQLEAAE